MPAVLDRMMPKTARRLAVPRLDGKSALVTAAARGIGRATALRLAAEGAAVFAIDIDRSALAGLNETGIQTEALDASNAAAIVALVERHGPFDMLINAVGRVHHGTILDVDQIEWDLSFRLNVDAAFHAIRMVMPGMLARGGGSIVNVASITSGPCTPPRKQP